MSSADFRILGTSGLKQFNGYVLEESLPELQGIRGVRVYREMSDNDPTVGAVLFTMKNLARNARKEIEPAKGGEKEAEFIDQCINDMSHPFDDCISEAMSMLPYGWAYHEKVFKIRGGRTKDPTTRSKYTDGRIGWRKLPLRSQDSLLRWEFQEDGGILGMWQLAPPMYQLTFIPISKALLFRTEMFKGSPEGRSILKNCLQAYYYKKRIQETEAIGIARDLSGLVTMEVPQELLATNPPPGLAALRADLEKMLSSIHRDQREFAMIPPELDSNGMPTGFKLKLLASGGKRQHHTTEVIARYSKDIAMSMQSELLFLGYDKAGSYALSKTKANMLGMALGTMLQQIANVFNQFGFPELLELNGMDPDKAPKLVFGEVFAPDPEELATYITKLSAVNAIETGKELSDKLLAIANLPKSTKPLDEDLTPNHDQGDAGLPPGQKKENSSKTKKPEAVSKGEDDEDDDDEDDA